MTQIRNDHQLSSKELNKILPSYLLEEIDKEHHDNEIQKISNEKLNMLMFKIMIICININVSIITQIVLITLLIMINFV